MGRTPKQLIPFMLVIGGVAWLTVKAFSAMIFASLGATAESVQSYILALAISLAIAGAFSGVRAMTGSQSGFGRVATIVSAAASGALLGFYYGGTATDNNPKIAIAGAVFGAVVMAIAISLVRRRFVAVVVAVAGAVAGYGFAFFVGAIAIAHFSTQNLIIGVAWGSLSVGYIWLTINSLILMVREINSACGTSFKGADLTDAKLDETTLQDTD